MIYENHPAAVCHSYCKYLIRFLFLTDGENIVYLRRVCSITSNHFDNSPVGFKLWMSEYVCVCVGIFFPNKPFGFQLCCCVSYCHRSARLPVWLLDVAQNHFYLCLTRLWPSKATVMRLQGKKCLFQISDLSKGNSFFFSCIIFQSELSALSDLTNKAPGFTTSFPPYTLFTPTTKYHTLWVEQSH